jgi:hypothetical protein
LNRWLILILDVGLDNSGAKQFGLALTKNSTLKSLNLQSMWHYSRFYIFADVKETKLGLKD